MGGWIPPPVTPVGHRVKAVNVVVGVCWIVTTIIDISDIAEDGCGAMDEWKWQL